MNDVHESSNNQLLSLVLNVSFDTNGEPINALVSNLENMVFHGAGIGAFTVGTDAIVDNWDCMVTVNKETAAAVENETLDIQGMLVVSTGHLCAKTRDRLNNGNDFGIASIWHTGYGWGMYLAAVYGAIDAPDSTVPDCIAAAADVADDANCPVLMFDADGPRHPALPFYDEEI